MCKHIFKRANSLIAVLIIALAMSAFAQETTTTQDPDMEMLVASASNSSERIYVKRIEPDRDQEDNRRIRLLYREFSNPEFDLKKKETPSEAFFRSVTPDRFGGTERIGFDRLVAREIQREWRRRFEADVENWRDSHPHCWDTDVDAMYERASQSLDVVRVAKWATRFPAYWDERVVQEITTVSGESIDIIRLGPFTLGNDLDVRYDFAPAAYFSRETERTRSSARGTPRGNLYTGDFFTIDDKIRLGAGLAAMGTGFVRNVGNSITFTAFSPYDNKSIFRIELSADYDATVNDLSLSVMLSFLHY